MKKVSIIVPSYNGDLYIEETIQSILGQSYENIELVIIDDASTDSSVSIINSFHDKRVIFLRNETNLGISETLNIGLHNATGEYIAFCGCDDIFEKDKIKTQVDFLEENPSISGLFSLATIIDEESRAVQPTTRSPLHIFEKMSNQSRFEWLRTFFVHDNCLCASSLVLRRADCGEGFDERLTLLQDLDFNIQLCLRGDIHILQEKLVRYRVSSQNISQLSTGNINAHMHEKLLILQRYSQIPHADLSLIFPELGTSLKYNNNSFNVLYLLARYSYELGTNVHRLYAIRLLTDNLQNAEFRAHVQKTFGFSSKSLYLMYTESGIFNLRYLHILLTTRLKRLKDRMTIKLARKIYDVFINLIIKLNLPVIYVLVEKIVNQIKPENGLWRFKRLRIRNHSLSNAQIIHRESSTNVHIPNYSRTDETLKENVLQPTIYIKDYQNVEIVGGLSYIIKGMDAFADLHELQGLGRVSLLNDLVTFQKKDIAVISCKEGEGTIDKGVMLAGTASYNYYHWLIEFIPKLSLFSQEELKSNRFIVDDAVINCPPLLESLQAIIKNDNLVEIKRGYKYKVNNLIYPSLLSWTTINIQKEYGIQPSDSITSPEAISYLRKTFLVKKPKTANRRIFISRSGSHLRRYNEADVISVVQRYGFEVCAPEKLSFLEQVQLFSEAGHIIGATGGGMTNIIFAPQNARILCLTSMRMNFAGFSNIAGIIGQHMSFLEGIIDSSSESVYEYQSAFTIDVDMFESAVKQLIAE